MTSRLHSHPVFSLTVLFCYWMAFIRWYGRCYRRDQLLRYCSRGLKSEAPKKAHSLHIIAPAFICSLIGCICRFHSNNIYWRPRRHFNPSVNSKLALPAECNPFQSFELLGWNLHEMRTSYEPSESRDSYSKCLLAKRSDCEISRPCASRNNVPNSNYSLNEGWFSARSTHSID